MGTFRSWLLVILFVFDLCISIESNVNTKSITINHDRYLLSSNGNGNENENGCDHGSGTNCDDDDNFDPDIPCDSPKSDCYSTTDARDDDDSDTDSDTDSDSDTDTDDDNDNDDTTTTTTTPTKHCEPHCDSHDNDTTTTDDDDGEDPDKGNSSGEGDGESSSEGALFSFDDTLEDIMGPILVVILIILPILFCILAAIYKSSYEGSDAPNYMSIWKGFAKVADLYTDIVFTIYILNDGFHLFPVCIGFLCVAHIVSNGIGIYYIIKWRNQHVIYFKDYAPICFILNLFAGFGPSIEILSSKLFYSKALSMQLSYSTRYRIEIYLILSTIFLENIPFLAVQIEQVLWNDYMSYTTVCAFLFTSYSLIIGSLTLLSRAVTTNCKFTYHFMETKILYNICVKSSALKPNHNYCHQLFAECLSYSLEISAGRIETVSITPINGGISCNVEILLDDDQQSIYQSLDNIQSDPFSFKSSLAKMLRIYNISGMEIVITKLNVNHDEESQRPNRSDWQKYKPFNQHQQQIPYSEIQEIDESIQEMNELQQHQTRQHQQQEITIEGDTNIDVITIGNDIQNTQTVQLPLRKSSE